MVVLLESCRNMQLPHLSPKISVSCKPFCLSLLPAEVVHLLWLICIVSSGIFVGRISQIYFLLWAQQCLNPTLGLTRLFDDTRSVSAWVLFAIPRYDHRRLQNACRQRTVHCTCVCSRDAGFIDSWFIQRSRSNCLVSTDVTCGILRFWQRSCWKFKSCACWTMSTGKFYRPSVGIYRFTQSNKYSEAGRYASPPSPVLTHVFLRGLSSWTAWPWRWKHCCYSKRQGVVSQMTNLNRGLFLQH